MSLGYPRITLQYAFRVTPGAGCFVYSRVHCDWVTLGYTPNVTPWDSVHPMVYQVTGPWSIKIKLDHSKSEFS